MTRRITDGDDNKEQDNHAQTKRIRQPEQNHREQFAETDRRQHTEHSSTEAGSEGWRQEDALSIPLAVEEFPPLTDAAVKGMEGFLCELCGGRFKQGDITAPLPIETPPAEAESVLCAVVHKSCRDRAVSEALEAAARRYLGLIQ